VVQFELHHYPIFFLIFLPHCDHGPCLSHERDHHHDHIARWHSSDEVLLAIGTLGAGVALDEQDNHEEFDPPETVGRQGQ
jgi:hypothetical protein